MRRLEARAIAHSFGNHRVLNDLSVLVEQGQSLAISGPSGSGKSTLLSILGLLITPDSGVVEIDGKIMSRRSQLATNRVAWVFQAGNALLARTVIDNAMLGSLLSGVDEDTAKRRASDALSCVGLGDHHKAITSTLSGGELQRLCIARALAGRSRIILADEPTGQLDLKTSEQVVDYLLDAHHERITIVATHDPLLALRCDRELWLEGGRLVER